ncbi:MAG TPA: HIT family protein [Anaeromyxobacteraceae bacterium]|nr:HIT family protein [Anaeromyxobacteraceae bacterium]
MSEAPLSCLGCRIVRGEHTPTGGVVWRGDGFTAHTLAEPSPIPGWLVLTSDRHARGLYDLDLAELAALGPAAARVMRAQRAALCAEHVYAFALGDKLLHFHLHLVPRFADTPQRLRGRGCFDSRPDDALPGWRIVAAAEAVRRALAAEGPR